VYWQARSYPEARQHVHPRRFRQKKKRERETDRQRERQAEREGVLLIKDDPECQQFTVDVSTA